MSAPNEEGSAKQPYRLVYLAYPVWYPVSHHKMDLMSSPSTLSHLCNISQSELPQVPSQYHRMPEMSWPQLPIVSSPCRDSKTNLVQMNVPQCVMPYEVYHSRPDSPSAARAQALINEATSPSEGLAISLSSETDKIPDAAPLEYGWQPLHMSDFTTSPPRPVYRMPIQNSPSYRYTIRLSNKDPIVRVPNGANEADHRRNAASSLYGTYAAGLPSSSASHCPASSPRGSNYRSFLNNTKPNIRQNNRKENYSSGDENISNGKQTEALVEIEETHQSKTASVEYDEDDEDDEDSRLDLYQSEKELDSDEQYVGSKMRPKKRKRAVTLPGSESASNEDSDDASAESPDDQEFGQPPRGPKKQNPQLLWKRGQVPRPNEVTADSALITRREMIENSPELTESANAPIRGFLDCGHGCPARLHSLLDFIKHLDTAHDKTYRPYKCCVDICVWSVIGFTKRGECSRHMRAQHCYPEYKCTFAGCDKAFQRSDSFQRHVRITHENPSSRFNGAKCGSFGSEKMKKRAGSGLNKKKCKRSRRV